MNSMQKLDRIIMPNNVMPPRVKSWYQLLCRIEKILKEKDIEYNNDFTVEFEEMDFSITPDAVFQRRWNIGELKVRAFDELRGIIPSIEHLKEIHECVHTHPYKNYELHDCREGINKLLDFIWRAQE